jgi:regulator of sirC expression with transglutaminase-like and TPR domain
MQKKQNADAADELEKYLKLVPKAPDADKLRSTIADLRKSS